MTDGIIKRGRAREVVDERESKEDFQKQKERKKYLRKEKIDEEDKVKRTVASGVSSPQSAKAVHMPKSPLLLDIEDVLEHGLEGYYKSLSAIQKQQFKQEGEKTARSIEVILQKARIKITEIISLIRKWLSLLPGINRFFVEQEAKIKADKIIVLKKEGTEP